jgi:hypothetical protein
VDLGSGKTLDSFLWSLVLFRTQLGVQKEVSRSGSLSSFSINYWMIVNLYFSCWITSNSTRGVTMYLVWLYYVLLKIHYCFSIDLILVTNYQFVIVVKLPLILIIVKFTIFVYIMVLNGDLVPTLIIVVL